jgi:hypothetical protein
MKKFTLLLVVVFACGCSAFAQAPIITVTLKNGDAFSVTSSPRLDIYGLSERAKPIVQSSRNRKIEAAAYATGPVIRTLDPPRAIQEILVQLSEQSGHNLASFQNSKMGTIAPAFLLLAVGEKSVWNLFLTPNGEDTFVLSVTCLIDE